MEPESELSVSVTTPVSENKIDIFNILDEVIESSVLPNLEWNDLLRLRRVCKWIKAITDDYLKLHPELAPEIEINEDDKSFEAFLKMGIPTSKIFLNNISGNEFYGKAADHDVIEFLEGFGADVKFLRVDQLSFFIYGKELDFLDGLKNLQSLEAERCGGYRRGLSREEVNAAFKQDFELIQKDPRFDATYCPITPANVFKRLRILRIGNNEENFYQDICDYVDLLMYLGTSLEQVALPYCYHLYAPDDGPEVRRLPKGLVVWFCNAYHNLSRRIAEKTKNYEIIDFVNYQSFEPLCTPGTILHMAPFFLDVSVLCLKEGTKLYNVVSNWYDVRNYYGNEEHRNPNLGTVVVSLINVHPSAISLELGNLQAIKVITSRSSPGEDWWEEHQEWPSLEVMDITVDSREGTVYEWDPMRESFLMTTTSTKDLFNFLFKDVSRTTVKELRLDFKPEEGKGTFTPKLELIVSSCPNLKKVTIVNWPGTNKSLTKLWSGLPGLEEVSLEYCKHLGNVAFVGEDVERPLFLKLSKMKKVTLKGLDQMPKITDTLFSSVIRHMKLTHLILTSDSPLNSVTLAGVRSLCDGPFAESIEKFPFKEWSLANVSAEELLEHEAFFRSYNML